MVQHAKWIPHEDIKDFKLVTVASGGFSNIYRGRMEPNGTVALKNVRRSEYQLERILQEASLWVTLQHPNILPFLGIWESKGELHLVSPWAWRGHIITYLESLPVEVAPPLARLLAEIGAGIEYLHNRGIIHGDIKSSNILVSEEGKCLVSDFGLSKFATSATASSLSSAGTARWMAPELINGEHKSFASDTWALGMLTTELITRKPPFCDLSDGPPVILAIIIHKTRPKRPKNMSVVEEALWDIAMICCCEEPNDRPGMNELHALFNELDNHGTNSSDLSALLTKLGITSQCTWNDCQSPAIHRSSYCMAHCRTAIRQGLIPGCLVCQERPKLAEHQYCGEECQEGLTKRAPCLLRLGHFDPQYKSAADMLRNSWNGFKSPPPELVYVYKVIFPESLWKRHTDYRDQLEKRHNFQSRDLAPGNELRRWHGTRRNCTLGDDPAALEFCSSASCCLCGILQHSFDRGWAGRAPKRPCKGRLGKGIYTSFSASKANEYSASPSNTPLKALILATIAAGNTYDVTTRVQNLEKPPDGFDSVFGIVEQGSEYEDDEVAVFDNDAIRPIFVVIYRGKLFVALEDMSLHPW
ncbi:hypothetical protein FRC03_002398 [Tulasnella sp. 419]|nr:hypothetical protein FRC03_002398 [Tulasnella sp. 419]